MERSVQARLWSLGVWGLACSLLCQSLYVGTEGWGAESGDQSQRLCDAAERKRPLGRTPRSMVAHTADKKHTCQTGGGKTLGLSKGQPSWLGKHWCILSC